MEPIKDEMIALRDAYHHADNDCDEEILAVYRKTLELAAARGGTMSVPEIASLFEMPWVVNRVPMERVQAHISALGARNAVLEAEREDYRNKMELAQEGEAERDRAMHEAQDEVEKLRERLSAAEESNRELVRRAQQAEGEARYWQKEHAVMVIQAKDAREEARSLRDRCERLSAAGQVLSAHVDNPRVLPDVDMMCGECHGVHPHRFFESGTEQGEGWRCSSCGHRYSVKQRYPCSLTCTHNDAAKPGHPERVAEASRRFMDGLLAGYSDAKEAERVKERSKVVNTAIRMTIKDNRGNVVSDGMISLDDDVDDSGHSEDFEEGAEAMRAACWEAVQEYLNRIGCADGAQLRRALKAAIEGAAP